MPVVKKTVAIHPGLDRTVRRFQAILVAMGYNATYSTALNYMVLYHISDVTHRRMHPEVVKDLRKFLEDRETVNEILNEDALNEYLEQSRKRIRERYVT